LEDLVAQKVDRKINWYAVALAAVLGFALAVLVFKVGIPLLQRTPAAAKNIDNKGMSLASQDASSSVFDNSGQPALAIPLNGATAYTFDFKTLAEEMGKHAEFQPSGLYLANVYGNALQFTFIRSGEFTSMKSELLGADVGGTPNSQDLTIYRITGPAPEPEDPLLKSDTQLYDLPGFTGRYPLSSYRDVYYQPNGGTPYTVPPPLLLKPRFTISSLGSFPTGLNAGAPTIQRFAQWYSSLNLKSIIASYTVGDPAYYEFTSQQLSLNELQKSGINVTFLDCSGGQVKKADPKDLKGYPDLGTLNSGTTTDKICFTLAPYYVQSDMPTGIWPQNYGTYSDPNDARVLVNHTWVANNLLVLLMDR